MDHIIDLVYLKNLLKIKAIRPKEAVKYKPRIDPRPSCEV
jgi:hypothetical protein